MRNPKSGPRWTALSVPMALALNAAVDNGGWLRPYMTTINTICALIDRGLVGIREAHDCGHAHRVTAAGYTAVGRENE